MTKMTKAINDINAGMILTLLELGSTITLGSSQIISLNADLANRYIEISVNGSSNGLWNLTKEGVVEALYDAVKILEDDLDPDNESHDSDEIETINQDLGEIKRLIEEVTFNPNKSLDAVSLKNKMEDCADAIETMANTYMLDNGNASYECQRVNVIQRLGDLFSTINGIEDNDLKHTN